MLQFQLQVCYLRGLVDSQQEVEETRKDGPQRQNEGRVMSQMAMQGLQCVSWHLVTTAKATSGQWHRQKEG